MSALLSSKKQIYIFFALICLQIGLISPAFAQESNPRPNSSGGAAESEESTPGAPALPPADISDLGSVTVDGLKEKPIYWMCRNREIVRTIRIEHVGGGCNTLYTKDGAERVVSQAMSTYSCTHVFGNIRRNLTSAGWKCRDISDSRVSTSP